MKNQGRLKIFFSYADGAGKTYAMLKSAQACQSNGMDVAVGYLALTEDKKNQEAVKGLKRLEPLRMESNGSMLEEFDLDEAIRRKPDLLVLDELAHENIAGSRHKSRYQDVQELLRLGMDVYTTLNVQHIESLADTILAVTKETPKERIPDRVFDGADQVELVDVEPEMVLERAAGSSEKKEELEALREIALHRMADRINKRYAEKDSPAEKLYTGEHVLTGLTASPSSLKVIRTAARMADAYHASLTALYVETTQDKKMSDEERCSLKENMELAGKLGAKIITVYGEDAAQQIAEYARMAGITKIVVGRTLRHERKPMGGGNFIDRLAAMAGEPDIYIIPSDCTDETERPAHQRIGISSSGFSMKDTIKTLGILVGATLLGELMFCIGVSEINIIMLYILGVLLTAMWTSSKVYSLISSFISVFTFNFFFTDPQYSLKAYGPEYPVTFAMMFLAAFLISTLTTRVKEQAHQAAEKAYRTELLLETSQKLQLARNADDIIRETAGQMEKMLGRTVFFYVPDANNNLQLRPGPERRKVQKEYISEDEKAVACWAYKNNKHAGATTDTLPASRCLYLAVRGTKKALAVAGIAMDEEELKLFEKSLMIAMLNECALALEKQRLYEENKEIELNARQERLRANLLRAISHDLRTPLTGISGNASVLLGNGAQMEERQRKKIYGDIYDDAIWLINLVENLLSVTRIENGSMNLNLQTELLDDVVNEAMRHLDRKHTEHVIKVVQDEEFLMAKMDTRLIVQVFINIIDNAVKYTQRGSEIKVHIFKKEGYIYTEIADDGPGVADENKEKLFQMFFTADNQKGDSRRGLGLGLALCKAIINAHMGEIGVKDNQPGGSVFYFTLPAEEVVIHE